MVEFGFQCLALRETEEGRKERKEEEKERARDRKSMEESRREAEQGGVKRERKGGRETERQRGERGEGTGSEGERQRERGQTDTEVGKREGERDAQKDRRGGKEAVVGETEKGHLSLLKAYNYTHTHTFLLPTLFSASLTQTHTIHTATDIQYTQKTWKNFLPFKFTHHVGVSDDCN